MNTLQAMLCSIKICMYFSQFWGMKHFLGPVCDIQPLTKNKNKTKQNKTKPEHFLLCASGHPWILIVNRAIQTNSQAQSIMHSAGNGLIFAWKTVFKFVQMANSRQSLLCFKIGQVLHQYPPHQEIILKIWNNESVTSIWYLFELKFL